MAESTYDTVPYLMKAFVETHPRRMRASAHLLGFPAAPPDKCRVLELGCAIGGNLIPMAYDLRDAHFMGIDLSEKQIEQAKDFARGAGVSNVDLRAASITEFSRDWGKFDYIICHGVYSWVPRDVQESILALCSELLADNGVANVSFNVYPGWYTHMWARQAMLFHVAPIADPLAKARAAREFLIELADSPHLKGAGAFLTLEAQSFRNQSESYILHEHLEPDNEPLFFTDFASRCAKHNLQYLGDARHGDFTRGVAWEQAKKWLNAPDTDRARAEQYTDLITNRAFRRALICRSSATIDRSDQLERVGDMHAIAYLQQWSHGGGMTRFECPGRGSFITGNASVRTALSTIAGKFPRAVPVAELAAGPDGNDVKEAILQCASQAILQLYLDPPTSCIEPGDCPRASAVARHLLALGQQPISLGHQSVTVDPTQLRILPLLDGTRNRDAIATQLSLQRHVIDRAIAMFTQASLLEA